MPAVIEWESVHHLHNVSSPVTLQKNLAMLSGNTFRIQPTDIQVRRIYITATLKGTAEELTYVTYKCPVLEKGPGSSGQTWSFDKHTHSV